MLHALSHSRYEMVLLQRDEEWFVIKSMKWFIIKEESAHLLSAEGASYPRRLPAVDVDVSRYRCHFSSGVSMASDSACPADVESDAKASHPNARKTQVATQATLTLHPSVEEEQFLDVAG